jgi:hypothetical protein
MSRLLLAFLACLALLTPACASRGGVTVQLDEYSVSADPSSSPAGDITFTARNVGAIVHQLLVLATRLDADDLPVEDGVVQVDEQKVRTAGEVDLVTADDTEVLTLDLAPGNYVLICNIASHYDNGMRAGFRVTRGVTPAP